MTKQRVKYHATFGYVYVGRDRPGIVVKITAGREQNAVIIAAGVAVCHVDDRYDAVKGRVVAIEKALRECGVSREVRKLVWEDMWESGLRRPRK